MGSVKPAEFYDKIFREKEDYRCHYDKSSYFPMWKRVAEIIELMGIEDFAKVTDYGCGTGQFAEFLNFPSYSGYDFSSEAIRLAQARNPFMHFLQCDLTNHYNWDNWDIHSDLYIMLEFLEHIEQDTYILSGIPRDAFKIFSVPDFDSAGHVRYFSSEEEVINRYLPYFTTLTVETFKFPDSRIFIGYGK